MYRQSTSEKKRSQGFKLSHALQIVLLVAICFWLLYLVKHSHDNKEFGTMMSRNMQEQSDIVNFGRESLNNEKPIGEQTKGEDDEQGNTAEEKDDEGKGDGDDQLKVLFHDKFGRAGELSDDTEEPEDGNEKGIEEKDDNRGSQTETKNFVADHDHDEESRDTHEEQYNAYVTVVA